MYDNRCIECDGLKGSCGKCKESSSELNNDRVQLESLIIQRQMLNNYRATQAAQSERVTMDSLFIQVSRDEQEQLIKLAIEALQARTLST